jgi:hypothetical protein
MKKIKFLVPLIVIIVILIKCNTVKTSGLENIPKEKLVSFNADILPIMQNSCTPCHFPPEGKKKPLENYVNVKENIKDIIFRVKLPKDHVQFMPFKNKKPALNDSLIAVLEKWEKQNMPE